MKLGSFVTHTHEFTGLRQIGIIASLEVENSFLVYFDEEDYSYYPKEELKLLDKFQVLRLASVGLNEQPDRELIENWRM